MEPKSSADSESQVDDPATQDPVHEDFVNTVEVHFAWVQNDPTGWMYELAAYTTLQEPPRPFTGSLSILVLEELPPSSCGSNLQRFAAFEDTTFASMDFEEGTLVDKVNRTINSTLDVAFGWEVTDAITGRSWQGAAALPGRSDGHEEPGARDEGEWIQAITLDVFRDEDYDGQPHQVMQWQGMGPLGACHFVHDAYIHVYRIYDGNQRELVKEDTYRGLDPFYAANGPVYQLFLRNLEEGTYLASLSIQHDKVDFPPVERSFYVFG